MPYQPTGKPAGRPPLDEPRRNVTSVRLTDAEHALVVAAAGEEGIGVWMRKRVLAAAKRHKPAARTAGESAPQGPPDAP